MFCLYVLLQPLILKPHFKIYNPISIDLSYNENRLSNINTVNVGH
jgi:hypothetical protein